MSLKSIFGIIICVLAGIWSLKWAYYELTDGFSISNITSDHPNDSRWEISPLTDAQQQELDKALSQTYHYLGKGHQAYVFESKDQQYVVKFLKFQKYRHHPLWQAIPLPESFEKKRMAQSLHKIDKQNALLTSWKIAFTKLPNETQVLFIHLNRNSFEKVLTLTNKSGIEYNLQLGNYVFMVQRKAQMFADVLQEHMSKGDFESAKNLLSGLLELYQNEYKQGLFEEDRYIVRNTGVLHNKPIQIDTGRLRENEIYKNPLKQAHEILWKTTLLQEWLTENYPELAAYFQQRLQAFQGI